MSPKNIIELTFAILEKNPAITGMNPYGFAVSVRRLLQLSAAMNRLNELACERSLSKKA